MKFLPAQVQTFRSWRRFAAAVVSDGLLARYTVILFDVFDTLLFRSLAPYDCVLDAVVNELRWLAGQRGLMVRKDPRAARDEAYRILGARAMDSGFDHETNLQELLPLWMELVLGGPSDSVCDIAEKLVRRELECEKALVYLNPAMYEVVDRLRHEERRLVFVSDMYLGFDHTKKLLDVNGFADVFDAGYVSGDYLLLKQTGRLYTKVLAKEGVSSNQIIHIGDDPDCDGTMAARHGISACVVRDKTEDRRLRRVSYDVRRYRRDSAWAGPVVSGLVEEMADDIKHHEQLLGLRLFAPVYTAFAHTLAEKCRGANVNRIYFIAREGFLLKRLFDLIAPALWPNGDGPKSLYLCVSQLTAFLASSFRLDLRGLSSILFNKADVSIREVLTPFGLPEGYCSQLRQDTV